jgi:hypothetical protein
MDMDMDGYLAWAESTLGLQLLTDRLTISDLGENERGIVCGEAGIDAGAVIMRIPVSSIMTVRSAHDTPLEKIVSGIREEDGLALLLLYEKYVRGQGSKWWRHITCLPAEYHSISNFTEEELDMIKGCNLHAVAVQWKTQITNDYVELTAYLHQFESVLGAEFLESHFSRAHYHWALSTIWSRFISISPTPGSGVHESYKGMVPVIDMFNHSPTSKMSHVMSENGEDFLLYSGQRWEAGSELFLSYGLLPNSRLMMLYGFAIYNNPHAGVDVWAAMDPSGPNYEIKKGILLKAGVNCQEEPFVLRFNELPVALLLFIHVQHMDIMILRDVLKGPLSPKDKYLAQTKEFASNDTAVRKSLIATLKNLLNGYEEDIDHDERLLRAWGIIPSAHIQTADCKFIHPNQREMNAVILRHSEKSILLSVIDLL